MLKLLFLLVHALVGVLRSRRDVALENLVLRHQLLVALRANPSPRLRVADRALGSGSIASSLEDRTQPHQELYDKLFAGAVLNVPSLGAKQDEEAWTPDEIALLAGVLARGLEVFATHLVKGDWGTPACANVTRTEAR
jgi:hypothetical protein